MFPASSTLLYKIQLIIIFLSTLLLLGSTVCSFLGFKKLQPPLKVFAYYLLLAFVIDVTANILAIQKKPNLYLLHLYTLGEFIIISLFYKTLFKKQKAIQTNAWWFISLISIAIVLNTIFLEPLTSFNSNAKSLVQVVFISYGIIYFYSISNTLTLTSSFEKSIRLINSAILVYYSGTLFIFMFSGYLKKLDIVIHRGFWVFNASLYLVFQVLLFISIWRIFLKLTKSLS